MNWDAIGAIGELIGALAVVGSLVYLASQIHVSNLAAKQATMQELMNEMTSFLGRLSASQESANTWAIGLSQTRDLDEGELSQFFVFCLEITVVWERVYYLQKTVDVDDHLIHVVEANRMIIANSPGYKRWFKVMRDQFTAEFRDLIEQEMNEKVEFTQLKDRW